MEHDELELIDLRELQEILGIGRTKAHSLVASGDIPSIRIGRSIRIDRRVLGSWLERHTFPPTNK